MRKTICYEITLNHGCSCMLALFVPLIRECRLITSVAELQKSSIAHNLLTVHVSRRNTLCWNQIDQHPARKSAKNNRHGFIAHHRFSTHQFSNSSIFDQFCGHKPHYSRLLKPINFPLIERLEPPCNYFRVHYH